ncbi:hypothetical protein PInf_022704 [Phytophthora infestans]|nr:hypothetical protein PInf_022704 [Phytophthora infestans]
MHKVFQEARYIAEKGNSGIPAFSDEAATSSCIDSQKKVFKVTVATSTNQIRRLHYLLAKYDVADDSTDYRLKRQSEDIREQDYPLSSVNKTLRAHVKLEEMDLDVLVLPSKVKRDFLETLENNTKLSAGICTKILERVIPQNLESMATELAGRTREEFSDGLVRLVTQYKSDLRSALDEYAQQSSGPAVGFCLEQALLQSVGGSIQKWSAMVLEQYKTHMRSWKDEKETLAREYELSKVQDAETTASANDQKHLYESKLAQATEQLSELRRTLHSELNQKKSELERLKTELATMNLKHEVRVQNAESDLAWARSRTEELEKSIVADRQRKEEISRKFWNDSAEERLLLVEQKELMAQIVQLERELVHKKTKHVQKVFGLQNEHAKKVDRMRTEQANFERQLKSQARKDKNSLKVAHEKEKKSKLAECAALDKETADIQGKLAVFEAEDEAARSSAAANRDFFKSMPMISLPLMQAPAPAAGEHQPAGRSMKALTPKDYTTPIRFGSLDDTSTSSASPTTRSEAPQSNDMCKQS